MSTPSSPVKPAASSSLPPKKRGFSLFSCLPCLSPSSADNFAEKPALPSSPTPPVVAPVTEKVAPAPLKPADETSESSKVSEKELEEEAAAANAGGVVLPTEDTEGVTSAGVMPPGIGSKRVKKRTAGSKPEQVITSVEEGRAGAIVVQQPHHADDGEETDETESESDEDEEQSLIARGGVGIPIGEDGLPHPLLEPLAPELAGRKCLVLDLDETLVHSSFKQMVHQADYVVPVEIENQYHNVYVIKRPGVDHFLKAMGEIYEIVIFTASLSKYADPVLDQLDVHRVVKHRLFRESCYNNKGSYVKDLSQLGRPMSECIIIDNSPASYVFHPNNAIPTSSWFNDPHDTELTDMVPFLTDLALVEDVRSVLDQTFYP